MMALVRRAFVQRTGLTILGVPVAPLSMTTAAERILGHALAADDRPMVVCPTGAHGLVTAWRDPSFGSLLASSDLVLPDGMPVVWIGRAAGAKDMQRVFGPDLMLEVCASSVAHSLGHFLCGGRQGVAEELAGRLRKRFPGLHVCGTITPPEHPPESGDFDRIAEAFTASGARILWLGVSTPKQERWAAAIRERLPRGVIVTVGAAFDYHTGRIARAPAWMQASGLEWAARLLQDPRRLLPRYAVTVPLFAVLVLLQLGGLLPGTAREDAA